MQKGQGSITFLFNSIKSEKLMTPVISSNTRTATLERAAIKKNFPARDPVIFDIFDLNFFKSAFCNYLQVKGICYGAVPGIYLFIIILAAVF
jgi:hypothetical protein